MPSPVSADGEGGSAESGACDDVTVLPPATGFALPCTDALFGGEVFSSFWFVVGGFSFLGVFATVLSVAFAVDLVFGEASFGDGLSSLALDSNLVLADFGLFTTSFGEAFRAASGELEAASFGGAVSLSDGFRALFDLADASIFASFGCDDSVVFVAGFAAGFVAAAVFCSVAVGGRVAFEAEDGGGFVFSVDDIPSVFGAGAVVPKPFPSPPVTFPSALVPPPLASTADVLPSLLDIVTSH